MNNPDDQSVPLPPNTIPIVVNSGDTSNPPPPSEPNTIPIVVDQDDAGKQPPPPSEPNTIPIVVDQDDPGKQPPQFPPVQLETVLIAKSLNKYSDDGTAELKDVSFELLKGQLTCIMGRDEDGVSSLFRVLALEEPVTSGSLTILNKETSGLSIEERNTWRDTHIAYIRQSHLGLIEQTGHILVAYWLHYYDNLSWNEALETASQALKEVGITNHRGHMAIKELSIAEVACVSIAKAYARSRRHRCIYLFDDLFISLDRTSADELARLLHAAARQGKVGSGDSGKVIVVQTNRQDIISIFDQVLEMRDGELLRVR
jgi:ABC-type lipoprotein export system ATPase subunit